MKVLLGVVIAASVLTTSVQASNIMDELTETETTADCAEDTSYSLLRGNNLNYG